MEKLHVHVLIYLQLTTLSLSILHPLDFLALQSIHHSLSDSPGSHFFRSWDFTSDPCSFPGVLCLRNRVISLNLGDPRAGSPGLEGRLPPALGSLSSLQEFTLVPGRIPQSITRLASLRFFAVSRNYLSGEIPAGISNLKGLRTIDLSYNRLTGWIPGELGLLPGLSNLVLCHNRFTGPVPSFKLSASLSRVELMHNDLSGSLGPDTFPPSVEYISLASNRVTGRLDRVLDNLSRLNYLDLSQNRFTGTIPRVVFRFPIASLRLQRNMFYGRVEPDNWVTIGTVDLSYNRLSGEISPFLSTVRSLYLNSNRFTGLVPAGFVDRLLDERMRTLYLQHNFLSGIQINPTAEIPLSSSLCLQFNCMVPPPHTSCPSKAGTLMRRPTWQCRGLRE